MLLSDYLNLLQAKGQYTFTRTEAIQYLNTSENAFKLAAMRLIKKGRLARPLQCFYVITPIEYHEMGVPPPTWYIESLMKFHQQPYYVGLLSAAALHGAAHQQPQVFQVVTNQSLRPINIGRLSIQFFTKKSISPRSHQSIKTPTGYMQVSTPEVTALDLVEYVKSAGYLNHVATILAELQERFQVNNFAQILNAEKIEVPCVQRLGYILEKIEASPEIISFLKKWIKEKKPRFFPLRSDKIYKDSPKNKDWRLYINETIETDV